MLRHRSFASPSRHLAACCTPLVLFAAAACTDDPPLGPVHRVAPSLTVGVPGSGAVIDEGVTFLLPPGTAQYSSAIGAHDGASGTTTVVGSLSPFPVPGEFVQRELPIRWRIDAAGGVVTDTLALPAEAIVNGAAFDVNAAGQIAGVIVRFVETFQERLDAAVWEASGELRQLPKGGALHARASVIADDGTVYGIVDGEAARWSPTGVLERLGADPAWAGAWIRDVNDDGQVVGTINPAQLGQRAFRWDAATGFHFLRGLPRGGQTSAEAINASGLIVGTAADANGRVTAVLWHDDTTLTVIGHPAGATGSAATDVNDIGQVLGIVFWINAQGGGPSRPFLWQPRTGRTPIGPDTGTARTAVAAITERGVIVGEVAPARTGTLQAAWFRVRSDADIPNAAPTAEAGGPYPGPNVWINEGAVVTFLDGSRSADPNGDPLTYTWTFDNIAGGVTATGVRPALRIPDDGPGTSRVVVRLTVRDPAGLTGTATTTVRVDNFRPWFTVSDVTLPAGLRTHARIISFHDAGLLDAPWTSTVQWGDGASDRLTTTSVDAQGNGRVLLVHTYAAPGEYSAVLTITDKDGGARTRRFTVRVPGA